MVLSKRTILPLLAFLILLCLAGCGTNAHSTPAKTSQSGLSALPSGTGNNPEPGTENKPHPTPEGHTESIVVANGLAYVGSDNGKVYAFDASHGNIRWQSSENATSLFAVDGNRLYAGDANNVFYALDASNGSVLWQRSLGVEFNVVKVENGIVYVDALSGTSPSTIYALQGTNGTLLWQYALASDMPSLVAVSQGRVYNIPSHAATNTPATVTVLDATSSHVLWRLTPRTGDGAFGSGIGSGMAESNGVVYFSTTQGSVYAAQATNGQLLWRTSQAATDSFKQVFNVPAPVLMDGVVYAGTGNAIFAYRTSDGQQLWQYHTNEPGGGPPLSIQPLASHGMIYFDTAIPRGELVALHASDGKVLWHHVVTDGGGTDSLMLLNGFLLNQVGKVATWSTSDGRLVWSHNTDNGAGPPGPGRPVFTDTNTGTIYVGGGDGSLQALRVNDGAQLWTYHIPEKAVQQGAIYSAVVTFRASTNYEQALQLISDLGLKTFASCKFAWAPEDSKDWYTNGHSLEVAANANSAPLWLSRLQTLPEILQVQGRPVDAVYHCPMESGGPIQFLKPEEAGTYLQISFSSDTAYLKAWESLNRLGFRLADPCYEKERAQGQKPTWHAMGEESSFTQTHTLVLATTGFNATIWHQQLQSLTSIKQVTTLAGANCN